MSRLTTTQKPFKLWIFWGALFLKGPPWFIGSSNPSKPYLTPVPIIVVSNWAAVWSWHGQFFVSRCLISNIDSYSVCIYAYIIWFEIDIYIIYIYHIYILYLHTFIFVEREISLYSNSHTRMQTRVCSPNVGEEQILRLHSFQRKEAGKLGMKWQELLFLYNIP